MPVPGSRQPTYPSTAAGLPSAHHLAYTEILAVFEDSLSLLFFPPLSLFHCQQQFSRSLFQNQIVSPFLPVASSTLFLFFFFPYASLTDCHHTPSAVPTKNHCHLFFQQDPFFDSKTTSLESKILSQRQVTETKRNPTTIQNACQHSFRSDFGRRPRRLRCGLQLSSSYPCAEPG